jgi:hypothetical protein
MNNNESQVIGLGMVALGTIGLIWLLVSLVNRPRYSRKTNTPENAQEILNKFLSGYTGGNDSLDSMPVNALSSDESLPLEFVVLSGETVLVRANSEEEALAKFYAEVNDEDCPCGRPQACCVDDPEDEGPYCDCIETNETQTWIQEA